MTRAIDRATTHTCPGFEADRAYFAAQGRDMYSCDEGHPPITVHYAQYPAICAECRVECLEEADVEAVTCAWCGEAL